MTGSEQTLENQPTPDDVAEEKRRYMREYMRARRQSQEHGDRYKATARESMRMYMRTYRQAPEYKEKRAAKTKAEREAEREELEALRLKNPKKYAKLIEARNAAKRERSREYQREYQRRPEVIEKRKQAAANRTPEQAEKVKAQGRTRAKIYRVARKNGIDTKAVRNILARFESPAENKAA